MIQTIIVGIIEKTSSTSPSSSSSSSSSSSAYCQSPCGRYPDIAVAGRQATVVAPRAPTWSLLQGECGVAVTVGGVATGEVASGHHVCRVTLLQATPTTRLPLRSPSGYDRGRGRRGGAWRCCVTVETRRRVRGVGRGTVGVVRPQSQPLDVVPVSRPSLQEVVALRQNRRRVSGSEVGGTNTSCCPCRRRRAGNSSNSSNNRSCF